jgi:ATP adenylyltransferase
LEQSNRKNECVFCAAQEKPDSPENLIVYRGRWAFLILNRYPYTSGHLMVVPYVHLPSIEELEPQSWSEIMEMASRSIRILKQVYKPEGFNVGINIGEAAGAGISDHVHLHVVPRWQGDTNFMSTLGQTRVLPEALEDTYRRIREAWLEHPR